jgi:hypothetical protein
MNPAEPQGWGFLAGPIRRDKAFFFASGNQRSPQFGQPTGTVTGFEPRQVQLRLRLDF